MNILPEQYAELARFILEEIKDETQAKESVARLAKLIVDNRDQAKADQILEQFEKLLKKSEGIVEAKVTSARELSKEQEEVLKMAIAKKFNIEANLIEISKEVDESLVGGLSIQVGDKVIDGSLRSKVEKLENSLS